jgi:hypothetical protein
MEATLNKTTLDASLSHRIQAMYRRDRVCLTLFVVALWATLLFALYVVWPFIATPAIGIILIVAGSLVLLFNTAAIVAMLRHYREDKQFIYSLDLKHLDEMRRQSR